MATTTEDILQQLLSLPAETRARLAEQLLESLEPTDAPELLPSSPR